MNADQLYNQILKGIVAKHGNDVTYSDFLMTEGRKRFGKKFAGVFPSDKVPKMKVGSYAIVNLDKSNEPGSHWVAVVKGSKKIYVYDSFGRASHQILRDSSIMGAGTTISDTEHDAEQDVDEDNCGQRVLAWLELFNQHGWKVASNI